MIRKITVVFNIDETDKIQEFIGKVFEREAEEAVLKAWKKVVSKHAKDELEERGVALPGPAVFCGEGDSMTAATEEDSGRNSAEDL